MFFSPKTSADGLVFNYDTGNTVRSYLGEPTTNLVNPDWSAWSVDGSGQGTVGTRTLLSTYHCRIVDVVANTRQYIFVEGVSASTQYTFSVKFLKITGAPTLRFQLQAYNGGSYISAWFPTTVQIGVADIDGWQTAYYTVTTPANTTRVLWFMQDGDDYTTYTHSFELKEPQAEAKSHPTQFTAGTRSATQGLKDLTAKNTINISTVSFDSNAQMTFDGTDDYVDVGDLGTIGSSYSLECVFKSTSVTSYKNIFDMNYATYSGVTGNTGPRLEQISGQGISVIWSGNTANNNLYNATPALTISANINYHLTFVQNGTTGAIYLNGILRDQVNNSQGYLQTFGDFNLGRGFILDPSRYSSGNVDMFKIYNQALTADQVQRNFNAVKSRFNIA
jgi:hypothetical protein